MNIFVILGRELQTSLSELGFIGFKNDRIKMREFAKQHGFTIVTQNSDFNELNSLYGFPPEIIWIRTGNLKISMILKILMGYNDEISDFLSQEEYGCFEIIEFKNS